MLKSDFSGPSHNYETDITIIGGGVAGCMAAMSLVQYYRVALVDKLEQPPERIGECLAPAARRILKKLNLLEGMEAQFTSSTDKTHLVHTGTRSYWGSEQPYVTDHLRNPDGFGWHLNRQVFESYLRQSAEQRGVKCLWGLKLHESSYDDPLWQLTLQPENKEAGEDASHIQSRFVIDASGRQSYFARRMGVEREHHDKLISCWATLADVEGNKMARISADKLGWWYSASLPHNRRVLALQTDSDLIDRSVIRDPFEFIELAKTNRAMAEVLNNSFAEITFEGSVAANSSRLKQVCGPRWAALGDAAISFDPLSSQGMFNAMAGALQLSELMHQLDVVQSKDKSRMQEFQDLYTQQTNRIWSHYLSHKKFFYGEERRWKDAAFWKRRHS